MQPLCFLLKNLPVLNWALGLFWTLGRRETRFRVSGIELQIPNNQSLGLITIETEVDQLQDLALAFSNKAGVRKSWAPGHHGHFILFGGA
jgi:hypothetical protein